MSRMRLHQSHELARVALAVVLAALLPLPIMAQWIATARQASVGGASGQRLAERHPAAARLLNGIDFHRSELYEQLWRSTAVRSAADTTTFAHAQRTVMSGVRFPVEAHIIAPEFSKLAPELAATLDWGRAFRRDLLGVLAADLSAAARDGEVAELVAAYRARGDLALSAIPKGFDILDGQPQSLEFRQRLPQTASLGWATRWSELALYEALVADSVGRNRDEAIIARLGQMLQRARERTPVVLPIAPAVAPTFSRRYPDAAAIVDNLHMLEEGIADVLLARDVPRSAKRPELLRLAGAYRGDTVHAITVSQWMHSAEMFGANNMGGPGVGFGSELPTPTLPRGTSLVGMSTHDMSAMGSTPNAAQAAPASPRAQSTLEGLLAIHARMMADPVIRERVATDPVLQKMLAGVALDSATTKMAGMDHANMPGMTMTPASAASMLKGTPAQRAQALDFVVKLLSDPAVEARIHTSAELHALWSDPEVQKRLADLKKKPPTTR